MNYRYYLRPVAHVSHLNLDEQRKYINPKADRQSGMIDIENNTIFIVPQLLDTGWWETRRIPVSESLLGAIHNTGPTYPGVFARGKRRHQTGEGGWEKKNTMCMYSDGCNSAQPCIHVELDLHI